MTDTEKFGLTSQSIYRLFRGDSPTIFKLAKYLSYKNQWKPLRELYEIYKKKHEYDETFESFKDDDKLIDLMVTTDDAFYFGKDGAKWWNSKSEREGVYLDQPYPINFDDPEFKLFFAVIFSRSIQKEAFLSYHFDKTFLGDLAKYRSFLAQMISENRDLIDDGKESWDIWIRENLEKETRGNDQNRFSQSQIAAAVLIQQHAGSRQRFEITGGKEKILQAIAKANGRSWTKLQQVYNEMCNSRSKDQEEQSILKLISKESNLNAIRHFLELESDSKALNQLTLYIDKLPKSS